ncbi:hypothetical protein ACGFJC_10980 [Nonomuraea fuscirosea]|uniref:hypothetical protein n=1 Tax=Nonomuraea fuscirosea TaxID=1291556 RepID=UPI00341EBB11
MAQVVGGTGGWWRGRTGGAEGTDWAGDTDGTGGAEDAGGTEVLTALRGRVVWVVLEVQTARVGRAGAPS